MVFVQTLLHKNKPLQKLNAGSHLSCLREGLTSDKFATGGNENPLKIWDLETGTICSKFTAKSVSLNF